MAKLKISIKQKKSIKSGSMIKFKKTPQELNPMKTLLDEKFVCQAIWECLKGNDPEGVMEILEIHIRAKNKAKLQRENSLPKTTVYHALKSKNPTLNTLAKLVHAMA